MAQENHKKMTETPVSRLILTLGLPTTISVLITSIYNLADTYFVGSLGESPQAATGVLFALQTIIQALAFMLGHGSGAFVTKYLADKDQKKASEYVSTAFFTGAAIGTFILTFGLIFLEPLMYLLGSTDTILPYAKDYGMWVLISCPFLICSLIINNNLRYEGKAFYAMFGLTSGGILNIFGDYILIRICNMGVYGAGLSTAVSQFISFCLLLFMYIRHAQGTILPKFISRSFRTYWDIIKVGFPSFIRQGLTSFSHGLLNNLLKPFGDAAIAAMSIVNKYSSFIMCVGLGVGQGFQPVAAYNYQVKKYDRVKQGVVFTLLFSIVCVTVFGMIGFAIAPEIINVFQKSPEVQIVGQPALRYASIGIIFIPLSLVTNMLYQSTRKAGIASLLALLRSGLVYIPVLVIMAAVIGLRGIEMAQPIADVLSGFISLPFAFLFFRKLPQNDGEDITDTKNNQQI